MHAANTTWRSFVFLLLSLLTLPNSVCAEQSSFKPNGFLDFNFYPYVQERGDNTFTLNALANFKENLQYFSLTNFSRSESRQELEEVDTFLSEQNLRWNIPNRILDFELTTQALIRSGDNNDALRFGLRFPLHSMPIVESLLRAMHAKYWINFHGAQFDHGERGYRWQIEHVFRIKVFPELLDNRVYIGGFADHNIERNRSSRTTWVQEAQLGIRLYDKLFAVIEQRYNGFRSGRENSLGIGAEYVIGF